MFPDQYLAAFTLTLLAGLSTSIGALIAFIPSARSDRFLSLGLGFSAGVMIYISFVEILPESQKAFATLSGSVPAGEAWGLGIFFAGIGLSALIDRFIPDEINPHELRSQNELRALEHPSRHPASLKRVGIFTAIAIAVHNFPEGFATFVSSIENPTLGVMIAVAIAIHNIPEGMAVALPMYKATGSRKEAFWYATLSGIAEPVGAVAGYFLLLPLMGEASLGITYALVAGIMIYVSFDELLPSARVYGNAHTSILGLTMGMAIMGGSLIVFKVV